MASALDRLTYAARQTARVAWYAGHYAAGRRRLKPMPKPDFAVGPTPSRDEMTKDMRAVFEREWQDIKAGLFPTPRPLSFDPGEFLRRSVLYFRDLPQVDARRHGQRDELPPGEQGDGLPDYYRQNFHFQSDGWLSDHSAAIYDTQVEVLFTGAADVMRRRALKPIAEWMAGRNQRHLAGLDVGCGTGRLLAFLHDAWPGMKFTGLDLSPPYLAEARRPTRPAAAGKAKRGRGRKPAVRRSQPRSRRLVVPDARAARDDPPAGAGRDGARAEARRPRRHRRFDPEGRPAVLGRLARPLPALFPRAVLRRVRQRQRRRVGRSGGTEARRQRARFPVESLGVHALGLNECPPSCLLSRSTKSAERPRTRSRRSTPCSATSMPSMSGRPSTCRCGCWRATPTARGRVACWGRPTGTGARSMC